MSVGLPVPVAHVLARGSFCHVVAPTEHGPHVTPMVFAVAGGRVWVTTSRGSVKARAWRRDPRVAGVVRSGEESVSFAGKVELFDLLEPETWGRSVREAPVLALATTRFTRKNARFFAGYAADARHVPLAWTPPGRVTVGFRMERSAVLGPRGVVASWSMPQDAIVFRDRFRASRAGASPLEALPASVRRELGSHGRGVLALEGPEGPVALPVGWVVDGAGLYAAVPEDAFELARCPTANVSAALAIDRPSWWRARAMVGAMIRGEAEVFAVEGLTSGKASAAGMVSATETDPVDAVLLRIRPHRLVWWRGWSSGTVTVP